MERRQQLPAEEVQMGRNIASLRIHVERAIETLNILKGTLPNSLSWIANQIVSLCAWLTNFQPALVPSAHGDTNEVELEIDEYLSMYYRSEAGSSSSSETDDWDGSASEDEDLLS